MSNYSTYREESLNKAYGQGSSNALDILKDSFGGHIPAELDLVNPPSYDIKFHSMFSSPKFYAMTVWETLKSQWLMMGVSWFALHAPVSTALVFGSTAVLKALSLKGYVDSSKPDVITMNDVWGLARHFDKADGGLADVVAHESAHLLQAHDERVSLSSAFSDNRTCLNLLFNDRSKFVKYLSHEAEMQARLFTVITNAYVQHGRLPTTKQELWATLASQDLSPPDEILDLAVHDRKTREAFGRFPKAQDYVDQYADKNAASDLNDVQKSIDTGADKFKLWNQVYPFLYGDMLEIMGDRLGQKRMGSDHNIQLREIFMRAAQDNMDGTITNDETIKRMKKVTAMMPADDAMSLMGMIASGGAYKEYNSDTVFIPMGYLRAVSAFTLAHHPDVPEQVAARKLHQATMMAPVAWKRQMEQAERYAQARDVTPQTSRKAPRHREMVANRWNPMGSLAIA